MNGDYPETPANSVPRPKTGWIATGCGILLFGFIFISIVGTIISAMSYVLIDRQPTRRFACKNNLRQIGLALHAYHEFYDSFPPALVTDENGKPMHSWRVLLLPHIEQQPLYDRYDFSQPWDSPANRFVLQHMPDIYRCPSETNVGSTNTSYAAVVGPDCAFAGAESVKIDNVTDGTAKTLMVGEAVGRGIPWTKPADIDVTRHPGLNQPNGFTGPHEDGVQFVFVDGAVGSVPDTIDGETLSNLFLRNDGNEIGDY